MKVYLHEITELDTDLSFTDQEKWVADTVARMDETEDHPTSSSAPGKTTQRPVEVHFNLRKVDEVVIVSGDMNTNTRLLCSRCANLFALPAKGSFSALFCKDPDMAGIAHLGRPAGARSPGKP